MGGVEEFLAHSLDHGLWHIGAAEELVHEIWTEKSVDEQRVDGRLLQQDVGTLCEEVHVNSEGAIHWVTGYSGGWE